MERDKDLRLEEVFTDDYQEMPAYERESQEAWSETPLHSKPIKELSNYELYDLLDRRMSARAAIQANRGEWQARLVAEEGKIFELELEIARRGLKQQH